MIITSWRAKKNFLKLKEISGSNEDFLWGIWKATPDQFFLKTELSILGAFTKWDGKSNTLKR